MSGRQERPQRFMTELFGKRKVLAGCLLIILLGFLLYARVLHAPFVFDDVKMIRENGAIKNLGKIANIWNEIKYPRLCFLTFLSFALNYHFGLYEPFGYHLVNLLLHVTTACLFFRLLLLLFETPVLRRNPSLPPKHLFALTGALIFLAHPLQTQAVTYVWSRTELLSAFFGMLSLLAYTAGRLRSRLFLIVLAVILFVTGVFARGSLVIWPLLVLFLEAVFFWDSLAGIRRSVMRHPLPVAGVGLLVGGCLFSLLRYAALLNVPWLYSETACSRITYLLTQFRVTVKYIQLCLWPVSQNLDYYFPPSGSLFEATTLASFLLLVVILAATFRIFSKKRLIAFGILWFFIALIPVSTVLVLTVVISESRLYFPMAGFSVFLTALIFAVVRRKETAAGILAVLIAGYGILTVCRNELWRSPVALMEDTVRKSPRHPRPKLVLAALYARAGRYREAVPLLQACIRMDPGYLAAYNNLGIIYMSLGEEAKAEKLFKQVVAIDQTYLYAYLNWGYLTLSQGRYWLSHDIFRRCLVYCGPSEMAYIGMADNYIARRSKYIQRRLMLQREGLPRDTLPNMDVKALERLRRALEINPKSWIAYDKECQIYEMSKNYSEALKAVEQWLRLAPHHYRALVHLGKIYGALNEPDKARHAFEKAVAVQPGRPEAYGELGKLYFSLGEFDRAREYYRQNSRMFKAAGQQPPPGRLKGWNE